MSQRDEVYAALQKADAAGDTAGAKQLADYIRMMPEDVPAQQAAPQTENIPWYQKNIPILNHPLVSKEGVGADLKRGFGLAGRAVSDAVAGLPLAAMDFGVGARNLLTGSNYDSASKQWNQGLNDMGVPEPQGMLEKGASLATSMMAGSKLPLPSIDNLAPAAFTKANPTQLTTLANSQKLGYVVPPSTTNPTVTNKLVESLGGKIATAQDAAAKNADITNGIVKAEFGIHPDAPLTSNTFKALRDEVAPAYDAIKKAGEMMTDPQYKAALDKIGSQFKGASESFPGLENDQVSKLVESMDQPSFNASSAIDATKVLRQKATDAYAQGNSTLGKAYKSASAALEDVIERNLQNAGEKGSELLSNFRNARQTIAKSFSAEKAFNPATGNVSAIKLAQQLTKGAPLSNGLKDVATFGQAFPKAAQAITDSGAVRNTDVLAGMGTSALSGEPGWLLYPFARMAARNAMLSPLGQKMAVPSGPANMQIPANISVQIARALGQ